MDTITNNNENSASPGFTAAVSPHSGPVNQALLISPLYRWGTQGSETSNNHQGHKAWQNQEASATRLSGYDTPCHGRFSLSGF